jgi:hypothetical protein
MDECCTRLLFFTWERKPVLKNVVECEKIRTNVGAVLHLQVGVSHGVRDLQVHGNALALVLSLALFCWGCHALDS